jgi:hypothetical protein
LYFYLHIGLLRSWIQGLSGTGKGTTVTKLQEKLPNVVTWYRGFKPEQICQMVCIFLHAHAHLCTLYTCFARSNGNLFRSLTLFAVEHCEQQVQ